MQHNQHISELATLFYRQGIRQVVICPGSRNAPLIQLFTSDVFFRCHSIVDERSAGYLALGMARELGEPVIVVTTSGTAVLNLAPAVAEAFHQQIPLVVMTADRPLEVIPQFNNQWLDQEAPFYTFSRGFLQLPVKVHHPDELERLMKQVKRLVVTAGTVPAGPVHINLSLSEPLYEKLPEPALEPEIVEEQLEADKVRCPELSVTPDQKILILAGMGTYDTKVREKLIKLLQSRQVVVVAENIANLREKEFCAHPELLLAGALESEKKELLPGLVISFGGQVVSKRLKLFLQSNPNMHRTEISGDVALFLDQLMGQHPPAVDFKNSYQQVWDAAGKRIMTEAREKMENLPFANLSAMDRILYALPGNTVLHLGNSGTIRYSQLVPRRIEQSCYANRGTSGIDGCVSTAVGAAKVSGEMHVLVVGDLSFVYDSNAMWNQDFPENLRIIVINDGGGGIFRLLDGPDQMDFFEEFSVTQHPVSLELLGQAFGRKVRRASDFQELDKELADLFQTGNKNCILEVDTTGSENSPIFKDFMNFKQ